jgi:hypothetical protein
MSPKVFKAAIRKLTDFQLELLRSSDRDDLFLEVQGMIVRLFEIQDQLTKTEEVKPSNEEVQP